jgi:tryptophanyl-tRNA synthetase
MSGLQGGKMSSSVPESLISLTEDPEEAGKKVKKAKTGGKITLEEQKRSGGNPGDCSVYELLMFHLIEDDKHLEEIYSECICGKRMCGNCKKLAAELITEFLQDHQQLRENARDELDDYL